MDIRFAEFSLPQSGAVVVGVWEDRALTGPARRLDEATQGAVARAVAAAPRFHGKKNELVPVIGPPGLPVSRIVLVGLGKPKAIDARLLEDLGGTLAAHLNSAGESEATFAVDLGAGAPVKPAEAAARLAYGAALRSYRFDKYRTKQKPEQKPSLSSITVSAASPGEAKQAYQALGAAAEAVAFTRDLVSEPANELYPESMAERAAALAGADLPGLTVEVLDENRLSELGMGALLGVAQGSVRPPRVVVMQYRGVAADVAPLAFIGKGVTFDTGGISIKPAGGRCGACRWPKAMTARSTATPPMSRTSPATAPPAASSAPSSCSALSITCPGRISTSPALPGRKRTRRPCRKAPPRLAFACSIASSPIITRATDANERSPERIVRNGWSGRDRHDRAAGGAQRRQSRDRSGIGRRLSPLRRRRGALGRDPDRKRRVFLRRL